MKKNIIAILLLSFIVFWGFNVKLTAEEVRLFPAVTVSNSGEKWGYINSEGTFEIKPVYDFAYDFNNEGVAIVAEGKYSYGICKVYFINKSGNVLSGPFSTYIPTFRNGIVTMNIEGKGSVAVNEAGKVVLQTKYDLREYSEGLLVFYDSNTKLYGFMDLNGKIIISAKYISVDMFKDGKTVAQVNENKYLVLDKTGKVLKELTTYQSINSSEEISAFYDEKAKAFGYKSDDGTVVIKPKYNRADYFVDGFAIVGIDDEEHQYLGVINNKGEYIIKPEYVEIIYLGEGLFGAAKDADSDFYSYGWSYPKAIFDSSGKKLSDYKYYKISEFDGEYASASDNTSTFFIDKSGSIISTLPVLKGIGQLTVSRDIVKAELDGGLVYLKKNGEIIWQKNESIAYNNGISINRIRYRRDFVTSAQYPEISGMSDLKIQTKVNAKLKDEFINNLNSDMEEAEITIDYTAAINKNLLIIEKNGYWYPRGAAHGQPSEEFFYIDIKTGTFYQLKDLFKKNSKYIDKLTSIVNYQMKLNSRVGELCYGEYTYFGDTVEVTAEQGFILGNDSIKIYYSPYEIAPFSAGFPEFEIPYGQILSIIDTNGAFWNSFDKKIVNNKIINMSNIEESKLKTLQSLIDTYEKSIIAAINYNAFSKVEGCLLKGSTLYNSQKNLVKSLNKQKISEKLTKYEIYAITSDINDTYKVFVLEEIAVKYPGKAFVNKQYQWCYTVKLDSSGAYKLSAIEKF